MLLSGDTLTESGKQSESTELEFFMYMRPTIKWRIALYQAEALRKLNTWQYGIRPHRNASNPVLIEELQFEISRASRKMLIQTNYDATVCYDRIISNLAVMVSKKFGVLPSNNASVQNWVLLTQATSIPANIPFTEPGKAAEILPWFGVSCQVYSSIATNNHPQVPITVDPIGLNPWA